MKTLKEVLAEMDRKHAAERRVEDAIHDASKEFVSTAIRKGLVDDAKPEPGEELALSVDHYICLLCGKEYLVSEERGIPKCLCGSSVMEWRPGQW